jgi:UDP-N-acetylglucosamine--N-acetylmuramyl-(pentapeptide) pyrophosphoryl-undecaprenol N-acetylglucosamine transferase
MARNRKKVVVVAAGGTGGHLFPAEALARELTERGWRVVLATDARGDQYAHAFPSETRIALNAATYEPGDPIGAMRAAIKIGQGVLQARTAYKRLDPAVVVGFGGYPAAPALLAAQQQKRPTIIHEQNSVLGRTNRKLAAKCHAVACAFPTLMKAPAGLVPVVVGNPVRPEVRALFEKPYAGLVDGPIRILVTGGSQGARVLSETVPAAIARLAAPLRERLIVDQQAREETLDRARAIYAEAGVKATVAPFFRDIAGRLGEAQLVIGRAGASTCTELAIAGVPAVLVPLKIAADDHQTHNAALLKAVGAAEVIAEDDLTVDVLAERLQALLSDPLRLVERAAAARSVARPNASKDLADLVERVVA